MSTPQASCSSQARSDQADTLGGLKAVRERIARLAEEREGVLAATVDEITRRSRREDVIRTLLPEAGMSRNTYYPRRNGRPAQRPDAPGGVGLSDLRCRRSELEEEIGAATGTRNRMLRAAEGIDIAALASAAGVTETWVRWLRRSR